VERPVTTGYVNATLMCKACGKLWNNYWRNRETQEFINELSAETRIRVSDLVISIKGGDAVSQGTWVHRRVASERTVSLRRVDRDAKLIRKSKPMKWYITVAAVREFQQIARYRPDTDGPEFDKAAKCLERIAETAKLTKDEGHRQIWMAKTLLDGRIARLELYVATGNRPEGNLPQLVRVRYKGGSRSGRPQKRDP
jgi:hypothetical protein